MFLDTQQTNTNKIRIMFLDTQHKQHKQDKNNVLNTTQTTQTRQNNVL